MIHTLEADGILLEFGIRRILSDVYLKCETGKITGILGRNGQGKTCLVNIISGNLKALSKSIRFDSQNVYEAFKRPGLLLYLPQISFIPEFLSISRIFNDFNLDLNEFENTFPEFTGKQNEKIRSLSGGHSRLVEIYIIVKSSFLFSMLDEPFSHIMPLHIEKIKNLLIKEKQKKGLFITDHLYTHITDLSDTLYILKDGKTWPAKTSTDLERFGYLKERNAGN